MTKIFLSYRRDDSQHPADRLFASMQAYLAPSDEVFIDVDGIKPGEDFERHLDERVSRCDVFLALIGPDWLSVKNDAGVRRLDDPKDWVRIEIASALRRNIPVVPVLLDGTPMPTAAQLPDNLQALSRRNAEELRRLTFDADVDRLMRKLGLGKRRGKPTPIMLIAAAALGIAVIAAGAAFFAMRQPEAQQTRAPPPADPLAALSAPVREVVLEARAAAAEGKRIADLGRAAAERARALATDARDDPPGPTNAPEFGYAGQDRTAGEAPLGVYERQDQLRGQSYEGTWLHENGAFYFHGPGVYYYRAENPRNFLSHAGAFTRNLMDRNGEIIWRDRSFYHGEIENDEPNGLGVMYLPNGHALAGRFVDRKLEGLGAEFDANGAPVPRRAGVWIDGQLPPS